MRLLISAAHRSSGKTSFTAGLAAALVARGLSVQTFKKGPDYIDPIWLGKAAARPCFNLDPYLSSFDEIDVRFRLAASEADIALIEGNQGLHDGLALDGSNSNAALAVHLQAPVLLVLDARGMTRGIAPLILGYQSFDPKVQIAGVILNQLGGARHEARLKQVIEHYTDVPVLGALQADTALHINERHLGLIPGNEVADASRTIEMLGKTIAERVDLDRLLAVAASIALVGDILSPQTAELTALTSSEDTIQIALARDRAFGFYYEDDLQALRAAGAELVPFDTLADSRLPAADALFIGGGFPESFAAELSANNALRDDIRRTLANGLPAYAECGGLMYLANSLQTEEGRYPMCGYVPGDAVMQPRPVGRGYVHLDATENFPWARPQNDKLGIRAHEFHYSELRNLPTHLRYAWSVSRGHGIDGKRDGLRIGNLLASYSHLRTTGAYPWAQNFVQFIRQCRAQKLYPSA